MSKSSAMPAKSAPAPTQHLALHQQLVASEPARVQLRDSLLSYLRTTPDPAPSTAVPPQLWAIPGSHTSPLEPENPPVTGAAQPPRLLVGDAPTLLASLRDLSLCCHELSKACHALPAPPTPIELHDDGLNWLRTRTAPVSPSDQHDHAKALNLLRLRSALCAHDFDSLSCHAKREAAFALARSLPYFNRDLTMFYLLQPEHPETIPEYELHVAHSLLRLAPMPTTLDHFVTVLRPTWRESGLLHVLTVAAVHMPSASVDWRLPSSCPTTASVQTLLHCLPMARSHAEAARTIARFIASAPGYTGSPMDRQAITRFTHTLDRLATLMRVKADAPAPDPKGHSLDAAITAHLPTPDRWTGELCPELLASLWASVKPALERALPPSALLALPEEGGHSW